MRALHALEDIGLLFNIFYTFVYEKVPGKITEKYMENLKQASGEIQAHVRPKNFLVQPLPCSFSLQFFFFFSEQPFYGNHNKFSFKLAQILFHCGINLKQERMSKGCIAQK